MRAVCALLPTEAFLSPVLLELHVHAAGMRALGPRMSALLKTAKDLGPEIAAALEERHASLAADGCVLLNDVRDFAARFCVFPSTHALNAVTLWAASSHIVEHFHTTPRLALLSPEPASGKTRCLEILSLLVRAPMFCLSASAAAIFRKLAKGPLTLLFDEVDAIWNRRGKDDANEDLRALLNAGYKRGATIPRCVGPLHDVADFPVYAAAALAGLGDLPDTLMSRSVIVRMRRRAEHETCAAFRFREHEAEGHALRDRLSAWAGEVGKRVGEAWPALPRGVTDRRAEIWEPLLAVSDMAGEEWSNQAREACVALCAVAEDRRVSLGIRLLSDLRVIFGDAIALSTEYLIERLVQGSGLEADAPWGDLQGKPIDSRRLAATLKRYGISSTKVKVDGRALQGYRRDALWDAWTRYLTSTSAQTEPVEPVELELAGMAIPSAPRVPLVPQVPEVRRGDGATNGVAHCGHCRRFTARGEGAAGHCAAFNQPTWPEPCPGCARFEPRA